MPDAKPGLSLPLRLDQRPSKTSAIMLVGLLLPVTACVLVPFAMMAQAGPDLVALAFQNPLAMAQLCLGALVWIALFVAPVAVFARRHGVARTVEVTSHSVTVTEASALGSDTRTTPLSSFDGIVHVVRTSVSGVRHELCLVDFDTRTRTVFLVADRIGRETVDDVIRLVGLPEIAARDALDLSGVKARPRTAAVADTGRASAPAPALAA
jgi:hypothetical protein